MKIEKNVKDQMTPIERKKAIQNGERADRVMAMPFTSEFKCYLSGISVRDFWFDVKKMAQAERIVFNRYGYDRIVIGPNTRGIVEALGGKFIYPENGVPYADAPMISDYKKLDDPAKAAEIFCRVYERPSLPMMSNRTGAAQEYYNKYHK